MYGGAELDMDWIHPWIGLDWARSFDRFIVFSEDGSAVV